MKQDNPNEILSDVTANEYKYGFVTDIETDIIPKGLSEEIIRHISQKKGEPEWLLDFRLKSYAYWKTLEMPHWAHLTIPEIDYQAISYYAAPKTKAAPKSLEEVDPELRKTFDKLGISLEEQMKLSGVAVDAVMDSVSVRTTFREKLEVDPRCTVSSEELDAIFDPRAFLTRAGVVFDRLESLSFE